MKLRLSNYTPKDTDSSLIPLINIVFLMLIFFMIAGHITIQEPFKVQSPISKSTVTPDDQSLTLAISADGELALAGLTVSRGELPGQLEEHKKDSTPLKLIVKADGQLKARDLKPVLRLLQESDIQKVRILTNPES